MHSLRCLEGTAYYQLIGDSSINESCSLWPRLADPAAGPEIDVCLCPFAEREE